MVTFTVKTDGFSSHCVWELLCEHFDVEVWKQHHTPDGKDLIMELVLHPKGSSRLKNLPRERKAEYLDKRTVSDNRPFLHARLPA